MGKMQKWSPVVLRVGLGLVMLWFSLQQLTSPDGWVSYLPEWTKMLPISQMTFVLLNGWFEITFGILLIKGFYTRIVSLALGLHMLGIVFSVGYNPTGVRDFGIAIGLISIFLNGPSAWSLDEYFKKKESEKITI